MDGCGTLSISLGLLRTRSEFASTAVELATTASARALLAMT
jgi:hypothetical protein